MKRLVRDVCLLLLCLLVFPAGVSAEDSSSSRAVRLFTYRVINSYPHDATAFTQGLVMADGVLYEGTGQWGHSSLRRVDLKTGNVVQIMELAGQYFGEGITVFNNTIFQLTWKSQRGFMYDRDSFRLIREFSYPAEGWGLTSDGRHLIASDGSATLRFLDPATLQEVRRMEVFDKGGAVNRLNELEYIDGEIYANVWQTDRIAIIDAATGRVTGWIDLTGLLGKEERRAGPVDVLNGIAHDSRHGHLYVTGKLWPRLFQIELVAQQAAH